MRYRVHFNDGTSEELEALNGDVAKARAKHERRQQTGAREGSDARVKVERVEELTSGQNGGR